MSISNDTLIKINQNLKPIHIPLGHLREGGGVLKKGVGRGVSKEVPVYSGP